MSMKLTSAKRPSSNTSRKIVPSICNGDQWSDLQASEPGREVVKPHPSCTFTFWSFSVQCSVNNSDIKSNLTTAKIVDTHKTRSVQYIKDSILMLSPFMS